MWWLFPFVVLVGLFYLIIVSVFFYGWNRTPVFIPDENDIKDILVSVIIPCRNEEANIHRLVSGLTQQSYLNYELIFVNDHSDDATRNCLEATCSIYSNIQLVDAVGFGKKNALKEGINKSSGSLIVTTDADCFHTSQWLATIVAFQKKYPGDLIICPVKLNPGKTLFANLQELEFASLVASGAGASGAGVPIMCNGANLVFTRDTWSKNQAGLHEEEQSGDDMFLMESVKKQGGKIRFLKSRLAIASTNQSDGLKDFLKQRRRWTSKSPAYTDWQIILTACTVFGVNLILLILFCLSFYNPVYLKIYLFFFLFKYFLDSTFLSSVRNFFQLKNIWFLSLILSFFYPFYIVSVAMSSFFFRSVKWN